jgi:RNA polymerase sigma-70 factor, ECF subfamily
MGQACAQSVWEAPVAFQLRYQSLPYAVFAMDSIAAAAHSRRMVDADRADIEATLAGDGTAYGRLVKKYQNEIAKRMWRFTRDRGALEELVQDVFVEVYTSLKGFRGEAPFVHWLNRIATRVGYRFWKTQARQASRTVPLQDWDTLVDADAETDELEAAEAGELLHEMLAALPPRDRLVLTLLYIEELSVAEAADRTGWSKTMVKVQAFRARKKLRALLENSRRSGDST